MTPTSPTHAAAPLAEDRLWDAVVSRRAAATFVYAVRTTGIYCRPSCPSRRPHRKNVRFFAAPGDAEGAGFRPCRRCRPEREARGIEALVAAEACRMIEAAAKAPPLAELARRAGYAPHHFHRLFKRVVGVTPGAYAKAARAKRLAAALGASRSVDDALARAGYDAPGRAYAEAPTTLGMTPGAWRKGGAGETLRWAVLPTSLGFLLAARTARGVCRTAFGDDPEALRQELERRFWAAELLPDDEAWGDWASRIQRLAEEGGPAPDLPLDLRGTAFQARVWAALREIPAGRTESYGALAARLGRPKAVRAVAGACARNEVALLVPCHRAVGKDGRLAGYRWGLERKAALLARETKDADGSGRR